MVFKLNMTLTNITMITVAPVNYKTLTFITDLINSLYGTRLPLQLI